MVWHFSYRPIYIYMCDTGLSHVDQLNEYLSANNLLPRFQSASRKGHSTETALLRVWSEMLMAADELSLLDMSASFGFVDHVILLQPLQVAVGIGDTALDWIRSFLSGRTHAVGRVRRRAIGYVGGAVWRSTGHDTRTAAVFYTAPLFAIIAKHRVNRRSSIRRRLATVSVGIADGTTIATDRR